MTKDQIRAILMANGFTVKEGQTELKPYVYEAAKALLAPAWEPLNPTAMYALERELPRATVWITGPAFKVPLLALWNPGQESAGHRRAFFLSGGDYYGSSEDWVNAADVSHVIRVVAPEMPS